MSYLLPRVSIYVRFILVWAGLTGCECKVWNAGAWRGEFLVILLIDGGLLIIFVDYFIIGP